MIFCLGEKRGARAIEKNAATIRLLHGEGERIKTTGSQKGDLKLP